MKHSITLTYFKPILFTERVCSVFKVFVFIPPKSFTNLARLSFISYLFRGCKSKLNKFSKDQLSWNRTLLVLSPNRFTHSPMGTKNIFPDDIIHRRFSTQIVVWHESGTSFISEFCLIFAIWWAHSISRVPLSDKQKAKIQIRGKRLLNLSKG